MIYEEAEAHRHFFGALLVGGSTNGIRCISPGGRQDGLTSLQMLLSQAIR
jgi:hypothetical protein